jgi:hypothetical protein
MGSLREQAGLTSAWAAAVSIRSALNRAGAASCAGLRAAYRSWRAGRFPGLGGAPGDEFRVMARSFGAVAVGAEQFHAVVGAGAQRAEVAAEHDVRRGRVGLAVACAADACTVVVGVVDVEESRVRDRAAVVVPGASRAGAAAPEGRVQLGAPLMHDAPFMAARTVGRAIVAWVRGGPRGAGGMTRPTLRHDRSSRPDPIAGTAADAFRIVAGAGVGSGPAYVTPRAQGPVRRRQHKRGPHTRGGPYSKDPGRGVNPAWQRLLCVGGAGDWGGRASRTAVAGKLEALEVADVGADGFADELAEAEVFGLGDAPPAVAFAERDAELDQPEAEIFHAGGIAPSRTGVV